MRGIEIPEHRFKRELPVQIRDSVIPGRDWVLSAGPIDNELLWKINILIYDFISNNCICFEWQCSTLIRPMNDGYFSVIM